MRSVGSRPAILRFTGRSFLLTRFYQVARFIGSLLALIGGIGLALGFIGLVDFDNFALGISAGVRVVGTVAITGCLLGAIGCFGLEYGSMSS